MIVDVLFELLLIEVWADVVIKSLSNVVTGVVVTSKCVVPVSYVLEVLSDVMVKALAVGINVEVMAGVGVDVSAAVMTLTMPIS